MENIQNYFFKECLFFDKQAHNSEVTFYQLLNGFEDEVAIPKVYYSNLCSEPERGVIIMEDLSDMAYTRAPVRPLLAEEVLQVRFEWINTMFNSMNFMIYVIYICLDYREECSVTCLGTKT